MRKTNLKLVQPVDVAHPTKTMPRRSPNAELRSREYLTPTEVDQLMTAAKGNRHGLRDATMILICYRHGFRASEICDLRWSQIDLDQAGEARHSVRPPSPRRRTSCLAPAQAREPGTLRLRLHDGTGGPFTTTWAAQRLSRKSCAK